MNDIFTPARKLLLSPTWNLWKTTVLLCDIFTQKNLFKIGLVKDDKMLRLQQVHCTLLKK
jgi:hypothetical protein